MKSLTLLILSATLAPAFFLMGRGAQLESWRAVCLAGAIVIAAAGGIYYLTGG